MTLLNKFNGFISPYLQKLGLRSQKAEIEHSNRFKSNVIINQTVVRPIHRQTQDIGKWRKALIAAEGTGQQRKLLYDLYHEILLDGFLKEAINKRIRAITNRDLTFTINGKEVEDIVKLTRYTFFECFIKEMMLSRFWGHSLVEVNWGRDGKGWSKLIDRRHVKPRFGIVTQNAHDMDGVDYRQEQFENRVIEAGEEEDLGLILEACQYVIFKRADFGNWAEFAEIFGMPFRWATYEQPEEKADLVEQLKEAGSAGYVVAKKGTEIDFKSTNTSQNNDIFKQLRLACNEELAICILGQTMTTTEAKSSGYAQSKTHMSVQDEIHKDDRKFITRILNEKLTPYLESIGYQTKGGEWSFKEEENLTKKEKLDIALKVASKVPVGNSYWYGEFGIPKPSADDLPAEPPEEKEADEENKPGESKKKSLSHRHLIKSQLLKLHYGVPKQGCQCADCRLKLADFDNKFVKIPKGIHSSFLKRLYNKVYKRTDVDPIMWREYYSRLRQFAEAGYAEILTHPKNFDEFKLMESIRRNLSHFAGYKVQTIQEELRSLKKMPLADFLEEGQKIMNRHSIAYFEAEAQTALAAANSAEKWSEHERLAYLYPNLLYDTAGDKRVRESHAKLDGIIRPVNDPFWDTFYPPNGYRCRCIVINTDQPVNDIAGDVEIPKGFKNNPGKTGLIFEKDHPYFNVPKNFKASIERNAEKHRALWESNEVKDLAQKFIGSDFKLPQLDEPMMVTQNSINQVMANSHSEEAVKNALLYALTMIVPQLRFSKFDETAWYYTIRLFDSDFYFKIIQEGEQLTLAAILQNID